MKSNLYQNNNEVFVSKVLGEVFKSTGYIEMVGKWMEIRLCVVFIICFLFIYMFIFSRKLVDLILYLCCNHINYIER
jgi:hypothetical protein